MKYAHVYIAEICAVKAAFADKKLIHFMPSFHLDVFSSFFSCFPTTGFCLQESDSILPNPILSCLLPLQITTKAKLPLQKTRILLDSKDKTKICNGAIVSLGFGFEERQIGMYITAVIYLLTTFRVTWVLYDECVMAALGVLYSCGRFK